MDDLELQAAFTASRTFSTPIGDRVFTQILPDGAALLTWMARLFPLDDSERYSLSMIGYARVRASVTGWRGVRVRDIVPDAPEDGEQPFSPIALQLLLEQQRGWRDQLGAALEARTLAVEAPLEAAEKN